MNLTDKDYYEIVKSRKNRNPIKKWIRSKAEKGYMFKEINIYMRDGMLMGDKEIEIVVEYGKGDKFGCYDFATICNNEAMEFGSLMEELEDEFKLFLKALERKRKISLI
jgi:hypothetical protein